MLSGPSISTVTASATEAKCICGTFNHIDGTWFSSNGFLVQPQIKERNASISVYIHIQSIELSVKYFKSSLNCNTCDCSKYFRDNSLNYN